MSYRDDVAISESQRQVDKANNNTAAGHKAADIAHYSRLVTASRTWKVKNGAMAALLQLGGTPPAGSFTQDNA